MIYLETSRLLIRDWIETDLEPFKLLNADVQVMQYFPKTLTHDETDIFYEMIQAEFRKHGFGLYAIEVKDNKEFIGFIGFHLATFNADFTPCREIGWRLKKDAWGKGYATEGAKACLEYGMKQLGFNEVYSFTAEINKPSHHVMEKIGLRFVKDFNHPQIVSGSPLVKHVLYHISRKKVV